MKKSNLLALLFAVFSTITFAQDVKYQLSSHILDVSEGQPAANVKIGLSKLDNSGNWQIIDQKITDKNGRINNFLKEESGVNNLGIYKLTYYTAPYFKLKDKESFYPFIEVVFELKDGNHYHVPITLSAFGYATYRGN